MKTMRHRPNPYRVLAHAVEVGDRALAAALMRRLITHEPHERRAREAVDRLLRSFGMTSPRG
jgi:hypothetical protein